jgi:hypothetical protein
VNWNEVPWATILTVLGAVVVIGVGAVVCVQGDISFDAYAKAVAGLVIGTGLLGIGRGIRRHGQPLAPARSRRRR